MSGTTQSQIPQATITAAIAMATAMIRFREKCSLTSYHGTADRPGVWTIGWGQITWNGAPVVQGMTITQDEADAGNAAIIAQIAAKVIAAAPANATVGQLAALISFAYNEGTSATLNSTLFKLYKAGSVVYAANQFPLWDISNGVKVFGLDIRRAAEQAIFLFAN